MMNLSAIDLNLLVVLDALLAEAHVGRAARRIGRSQPAVSHSLSRLRDLLGDPLLVRNGSRMALTPRAVSLKASLPPALERVRELLEAESFVPATSSRRFEAVMQDHVADLFLPDLVRRMHLQAPHVRLEVIPWLNPQSIPAERLRSIDFCITCSTDHTPGFERAALFTDTEAVVVRRGHPSASRLKSRRGFVESSHIAVVGRGRTQDPVDVWLLEKGVERRVTLTVPSYLQALHAAGSTDLVAFVPKRLAQRLAAQLSLVVLRPPIDPGTYQEYLLYPKVLARDAAARWLRDIVIDVGQRLGTNDRPH